MTFTNAPFLGDMLSSLLAAASASSAPLQHFQPPATAVGSPATPQQPAAANTRPSAPAGVRLAGGPRVTQSSGWPSAAASSRAVLVDVVVVEAIVLVCVCVGAVAVRAVTLRKQSGRVIRLAVTITALGVALATTLQAPRPARTDSSARAGAGPAVRQSVPVYVHNNPLARVDARAKAGPQVWQDLVSIEADISRAQVALDGAAADAPTKDFGQRTADLVAHARQLQATAIADERTLYVAVAGDPMASAQLQAAASASGDADAIAVIGVDLAIVRAEMAQQSAIGQAERALASVGALSSSQLSAIAARSPFIAPVIGPVTQGFGPTTLGIEPGAVEQGVSYAHFHTGLDIAAPLNSPVHAAADGTVLLAGASTDAQGNLVGYGIYVVIAHPQGFVTLYGHLSSISVHAGDSVRQGQIIGFEGSTGNSTGPHVHFEVRVGGNAVDPAPFVGAQLVGG